MADLIVQIVFIMATVFAYQMTFGGDAFKVHHAYPGVQSGTTSPATPIHPVLHKMRGPINASCVIYFNGCYDTDGSIHIDKGCCGAREADKYCVRYMPDTEFKAGQAKYDACLELQKSAGVVCRNWPDHVYNKNNDCPWRAPTKEML